MKRGFRFSIDRGGTFTDIYAEFNGKARVLKLLSEDPQNYPDAPREGIRRILQEVKAYFLTHCNAINVSLLNYGLWDYRSSFCLNFRNLFIARYKFFFLHNLCTLKLVVCWFWRINTAWRQGLYKVFTMNQGILARILLKQNRTNTWVKGGWNTD